MILTMIMTMIITITQGNSTDLITGTHPQIVTPIHTNTTMNMSTDIHTNMDMSTIMTIRRCASIICNSTRRWR